MFAQIFLPFAEIRTWQRYVLIMKYPPRLRKHEEHFQLENM